MHISKLLAVVPLIQATQGAVISRDDFPVPDGLCCFRLQDSSTGAFAQQDYHSGYLYFNANQPRGLYCFDFQHRPDILYDPYYNACILSGNKGQFQCLDPIAGGDTWKLRRQGDKVVLEDYGSTKFSACDSNPGEAIFGPVPPAGMQCRKDLQLEAVYIKGDCTGIH
jgi:hypothetical protein